jgi:regulation of enolase protein 1 (concanavalin A-like superfamily)
MWTAALQKSHRLAITPPSRQPTSPCYLSLTRQGKKFTAERSLDGKKWELVHSVEEAAPEKALIGLFALHDKSETLDIVFTDYSVTAPKK